MAPHPNDTQPSTLEDRFFGEPRTGLRQRLREAEQSRTQQMLTLAEVSGIEDVEALERLAPLGVGGESLAALTLYPLVAVAWADGKVDRHEREAVQRGAKAPRHAAQRV
jgi:hypothetical protein